jgi:hypothetical protein
VSTVDGIAAVVAAIAAVAALYFARDTVRLALTGSREARQQHDAQIAEMTAATEASAEQHRREMLDRRIAFDHEMAVRRLTQLQRVAEALLAVINAARQERMSESAKLDLGNGRLLSATPIMALQAQLRIEVRVLRQLRGPDLDHVIPPLARDDQSRELERLWFDGLTALQQVGGMIDTYEAFQPDAAFDRLHESTRKWAGSLLDGADPSDRNT